MKLILVQSLTCIARSFHKCTDLYRTIPFATYSTQPTWGIPPRFSWTWHQWNLASHWQAIHTIHNISDCTLPLISDAWECMKIDCCWYSVVSNWHRETLEQPFIICVSQQFAMGRLNQRKDFVFGLFRRVQLNIVHRFSIGRYFFFWSVIRG